MKSRLFTPGPTMVPDVVRAAMAAPLIHHRTEEFSNILRDVHDGMQWLFQTEQDVLMITASGTGAMESVVASLCRTDSHALAACGGKFGERWADLCETYNVPVTRMDTKWGDSVSVKDVAKTLDTDPSIDMLFLTQSETSTGAWTDIKAIAAEAHKHDVLIVVDAITGAGVHELYMDDWGLDVVVTGSQKGLMLPPGLSFVALSAKAWAAVEKSDLPSYYLSLSKAQRSWEKDSTPFTPAITLIIALAEVLKSMRAEGLTAIWQRHQRWADAVREGVKALGLELLAKMPSNVHTAILIPDSLDGGALSKHLESEYGMKVAGGQDSLKGKIIRVAHVGDLDDVEILGAVSLLERAFIDMGWTFDLGAGVLAAHRILAEEGREMMMEGK